MNELAAPEGETLWLIETSTLAQPNGPQRHFWTGENWDWCALHAARYPIRYAAECVVEKYKMFPIDNYPVCAHLFQCGISADKGQGNADEHTSGKWRVELSHIVAPADGDGEFPEECYTVAKLVGRDFQANARRIVACVNYCEGMPTEQLESSTIGHQGLQAERDLLRERERELVEALSALTDICDSVPVFQLDDGKASVKAVRLAAKFTGAHRIARAALAKVRP